MLEWKLVKSTGRSFAEKDGTYLVVGYHEHSQPRLFFYAAYRGGQEISYDSGYGSREQAQAAAEDVVL